MSFLNIVVNGSMSITNTTLAFFNDTCDRHDVAIQVSQRNDDGQFPIVTRSMFVYNSSERQPYFQWSAKSRCGKS